MEDSFSKLNCTLCLEEEERGVGAFLEPGRRGVGGRGRITKLAVVVEDLEVDVLEALGHTKGLREEIDIDDARS